MHCRAFQVGSTHISVRFYVCETTRCASFALLQRANLNEILIITAPFYNAFPLETGSLVIEISFQFAR